jgi:hypothetical protein
VRLLDGKVEGALHLKRQAESPLTSERKMMYSLVEEGEEKPTFLVGRRWPSLVPWRKFRVQYP